MKSTDLAKARHRKSIENGFCPAHPKKPLRPGTRACQEDYENRARKIEISKREGACVPHRNKKPCMKCRQIGVNSNQKRRGLTQDDFDKLLASQGNVCAVCGGPPTVFDKFVMDHDHDTGSTRGLLCHHCNVGLGRFKDSRNLLDRAKKYISDSRVNKFRELEIKMKVPMTGASTSFIQWMSSIENVKEYIRVTGQDVYWEKEGAVVRHRLNGPDGGELTSKSRRSSESTVDRVEVDLFLSKDTHPDDVAAFLSLSGFKPAVAITKTSHIFTVTLSECDVTVVYYEVSDDIGDIPTTAYVEVEIDKEADVKVSVATTILKEWQTTLISRGLEPVSDSLWEIYSGKRYQTL